MVFGQSMFTLIKEHIFSGNALLIKQYFQLITIFQRYLVDGVFQHDPLYPIECDENGNINNVVEIGKIENKKPINNEKKVLMDKCEKVATNDAEDESYSLKGSETADAACVPRDAGAVASADLSNNIQSCTQTDEGCQPNEKAEIISDTENVNSQNVNCTGQVCL